MQAGLLKHVLPFHCRCFTAAMLFCSSSAWAMAQAWGGPVLTKTRFWGSLRHICSSVKHFSDFDCSWSDKWTSSTCTPFFDKPSSFLQHITVNPDHTSTSLVLRWSGLREGTVFSLVLESCSVAVSFLWSRELGLFDAQEVHIWT